MKPYLIKHSGTIYLYAAVNYGYVLCDRTATSSLRNSRRPDLSEPRVCNLIRLLWGKARRRARSLPFGTLYSAFCTIFRAEHAPLPRICYYKGKSLGSDNPGRLNVELITFANLSRALRPICLQGSLDAGGERRQGGEAELLSTMEFLAILYGVYTIAQIGSD